MPDNQTQERFYPKGRREWREWLAKNHTAAPGVWPAVSRKGSVKPGVTLDEAVSEAIAFGWVDSRLNTLRAIGI